MNVTKIGNSIFILKSQKILSSQKSWHHSGGFALELFFTWFQFMINSCFYRKTFIATLVFLLIAEPINNPKG